VLRQILKRYKLWANMQGDVKFEREHSDVGKALTHDEEKELLTACASNPLLNSISIRRGIVGLRSSAVDPGFSYGTTELTEVPQFAKPSLVPPQVGIVRVNSSPTQFGYWM
jgi:hypothetical protein